MNQNDSDPHSCMLRIQDNGCGYIIIPKSILSDPDIETEETDLKQRQVATQFIKEQNIPIRRGDLIRFEYELGCAVRVYTDECKECGYYRNNHLYIWDGDKVAELDHSLCMYGNIPSSFLLYKEPEYFTQSYWHKFSRDTNPLCRGKFANPQSYEDSEWIENNPCLRDHLTPYTYEKENSHSSHQATLFYSWWIDSRQAKHYVLFNDHKERNKQAISDYLINRLEPLDVRVEEPENKDDSPRCDDWYELILRKLLTDGDLMIHYL